MAPPAFIFLAIFGLAMAALLVIATRMNIRFVPAMRRGAGIVASLVGVGLIVAIVLSYSLGSNTIMGSLRNGLMDTEVTLRHWFSSLSLR